MAAAGDTADMELVQEFNAQLSSLYNCRMPASQSKIREISNSAIKARKMYKHIVQSIERFIVTSDKEYKLPAVYVIDCIIRTIKKSEQIRDKVFISRFVPKFPQSFRTIFENCLFEDKPRIIKVLNLWRMHDLYPQDVIQPLLELSAATRNRNESQNPESSDFSECRDSGSSSRYEFPSESDRKRVIDQESMLFLTTLANSIQKASMRTDGGSEAPPPNEFENEEPGTPIESEPQYSKPKKSATPREDFENMARIKGNLQIPDDPSNLLFNHQINQVCSDLFFRLPEEKASLAAYSSPPSAEEVDDTHRKGYSSYDRDNERAIAGPTAAAASSRDRRSHSRGRRTRSSSGSSPSHSRDHSSRHKRHRRSRSRSRSRSPSRSAHHEKAQERRKKGIPSTRSNMMTVCSTTIWLGHVPKSAAENDLSDIFGEFGMVKSIDMIPSRGCAYVCLDRRQDAYKALHDFKYKKKILGTTVKVSWAPGKGLREKNFKDYWEADIGCSFIPMELVNASNIELLEDGGSIDEDSLSSHLKAIRAQIDSNREQESKAPTGLGLAPPPALPYPLGALPGVPLFPPPPLPPALAAAAAAASGTTTGAAPLQPPPPFMFVMPPRQPPPPPPIRGNSVGMPLWAPPPPLPQVPPPPLPQDSFNESSSVVGSASKPLSPSGGPRHFPDGVLPETSGSDLLPRNLVRDDNNNQRRRLDFGPPPPLPPPLHQPLLSFNRPPPPHPPFGMPLHPPPPQALLRPFDGPDHFGPPPPPHFRPPMGMDGPPPPMGMDGPPQMRMDGLPPPMGMDGPHLPLGGPFGPPMHPPMNHFHNGNAFFPGPHFPDKFHNDRWQNGPFDRFGPNNFNNNGGGGGGFGNNNNWNNNGNQMNNRRNKNKNKNNRGDRNFPPNGLGMNGGRNNEFDDSQRGDNGNGGECFESNNSNAEDSAGQRHEESVTEMASMDMSASPETHHEHLKSPSDAAITSSNGANENGGNCNEQSLNGGDMQQSSPPPASSPQPNPTVDVGGE